jgi:thioredoxin 1
MADGIITLTSSTFDETVRASSTPILVDFWAEWCGPCKQIAPILADIAQEKAGQVTIAKLNVDDYGDIAQQFGVMSIPTMILFDKGEAQKRIVGAVPKSRLLEEISGFLPSSQ